MFDLYSSLTSFSIATDLIISRILIFLLSFAKRYPPRGPLEATKILFFTKIWRVCSKYLFGIPCLFAIDTFCTGLTPELSAMSITASIA